MTLYDAIGGPGAVTAAVDDFYARVWADPELAPFFAGIDRRRLKHHQRAFLQAALSGTETYKGRDLATAHAGLAITDAAFDGVVRHLLDALRALEVAGAPIDAVAERIETLRDAVVTP